MRKRRLENRRYISVRMAIGASCTRTGPQLWWPMETKPNDPAAEEAQQPEAGEAPPKKDPKKAAGSLNPKETGAFYEAVIGKPGKRKRR